MKIFRNFFLSILLNPDITMTFHKYQELDTNSEVSSFPQRVRRSLNENPCEERDATVLREIGGKPVIIDVILCRNPGRECFYKDDDFDFSCKIENIDTKCNQVYTNFVINGEIQNLPSGCKCFEIEQ
eukprot:TRINITY_DN11780_c0_g1_i1.p1 TRINITY_DN11780_c0_g1~~TRINITY_DN11780_c0_g1_i1.p1  ORF type:complete len:127 (+),score=15.71 TRINITY_DN11780_c0_g1_i1:53-433(+)